MITRHCCLTEWEYCIIALHHPQYILLNCLLLSFNCPISGLTLQLYSVNYYYIIIIINSWLSNPDHFNMQYSLEGVLIYKGQGVAVVGISVVDVVRDD